MSEHLVFIQICLKARCSPIKIDSRVTLELRSIYLSKLRYCQKQYKKLLQNVASNLMSNAQVIKKVCLRACSIATFTEQIK